MTYRPAMWQASRSSALAICDPACQPLHPPWPTLSADATVMWTVENIALILLARYGCCTWSTVWDMLASRTCLYNAIMWCSWTLLILNLSDWLANNYAHFILLSSLYKFPSCSYWNRQGLLLAVHVQPRQGPSRPYATRLTCSLTHSVLCFRSTMHLARAASWITVAPPSECNDPWGLRVAPEGILRRDFQQAPHPQAYADYLSGGQEQASTIPC